MLIKRNRKTDHERYVGHLNWQVSQTHAITSHVNIADGEGMHVRGGETRAVKGRPAHPHPMKWRAPHPTARLGTPTRRTVCARLGIVGFRPNPVEPRIRRDLDGLSTGDSSPSKGLFDGSSTVLDGEKLDGARRGLPHRGKPVALQRPISIYVPGSREFSRPTREIPADDETCPCRLPSLFIFYIASLPPLPLLQASSVHNDAPRHRVHTYGCSC